MWELGGEGFRQGAWGGKKSNMGIVDRVMSLPLLINVLLKNDKIVILISGRAGPGPSWKMAGPGRAARPKGRAGPGRPIDKTGIPGPGRAAR
jgi:hypothetical protein